MPIINKIPSMVKSQVDLASYLVEDAFGSIKDISKNVQSHYTVQGSMQVGLLVFRFELLGLEMNFKVSHYSSGISAPIRCSCSSCS